MSVLAAETIPGFKVGTWNLDPAHTQVGFSIRHLMVSKVKGTFTGFEGTITTTESPADTQVKATIDVASVNTRQKDRDAHLVSADFFDAEKFPTIEFVSTGVRFENGDFKLDGSLTMHGVTKPVTLDVDFGGIAKNGYGKTIAGAEATLKINRADFGLTYNAALETGGMLLGDTVDVSIEVEAVLAE